jgi:hypothetical protein
MEASHAAKAAGWQLQPFQTRMGPTNLLWVCCTCASSSSSSRQQVAAGTSSSSSSSSSSRSCDRWAKAEQRRAGSLWAKAASSRGCRGLATHITCECHTVSKTAAGPQWGAPTYFGSAAHVRAAAAAAAAAGSRSQPATAAGPAADPASGGRKQSSAGQAACGQNRPAAGDAGD